ncbi:hypothetical protein [Aquibacillus rhizosphaerae]|uniref:Uncharacterized protein n=1 Tax=Aquibacillus rhizosphaerae TaxID=3051431 RepID=A0ABT7L1E7_9BACI|nr:hypothetical protein [Aquibacillus sp. LR5S19]MDL4839194.1 hypothetical protein [Aquibacillus sp. LR5S19]
MVTFRFLNVNQITSYFVDDVNHETAKKRSAAIQNRNTIRFQIEEANGKYFLISGFKFYDAAKHLHENRPLPCIISEDKSSTELDRLLKVLKQGMDREATSWRFKYNLIQVLTKEFSIDCSEMAKQLDKKVSEISKYKLEASIPDQYKERAIKTNTSDLINEIHLHPAIPDDHKEEYFQLALSGNLTLLQFYLAAYCYNLDYYSLYAHPFGLYRIVY